MRPARQPARQPMHAGDERMLTLPWIDFFDLVGLFQRQVAALPGTPSYANDAAAAAGDVPVGGIYRNGSAICVRVT